MRLASMRLALTITTGVMLLLAAGGCQTSLKALAKGTAGKLEAPDVPDRNLGELDNQVEPAGAMVASDAGQPITHSMMDNFRAGLEQSMTGQQSLAPPTPPANLPAANHPTQTTNSQAAKRAFDPLPTPTREDAFQKVLPILTEIGEKNPAAQQKLLAQLQTARPAHWASLAQRMRSNLGYHEYLTADANNKPASKVSPASHTHNTPQPQPEPEPEQPSPENKLNGFSAPQPPAYHPENRPAEKKTHHDTAVRQTAAMIEAVEKPNLKPSTMVFPASAHGEEREPYSLEPRTAPQHNKALHATALHREQADPANGDWRASLERTIELLEKQTSTHPQTVAEAYDHVRLGLLRAAAGNVSDAANPPPGLVNNEQQLWSNMMLASTTLMDFESQPDARRRAAAAGMHLDKATGALEQLGSLTVRGIAFCEELYGFGSYKPIKDARFRAGQTVTVYAEVENYKTRPTPQGIYTSLATSYKVLDKHGGRVDGGESTVVNDYCSRRRRDFHIKYTITLPETVYPGTYVLELTLTDLLGDKIGHGTIEFEIEEGEAAGK